MLTSWCQFSLFVFFSSWCTNFYISCVEGIYKDNKTNFYSISLQREKTRVGRRFIEQSYGLYSIGRFLRRTIPSPWNHSRRNCLAAPSGVLVHSTVIRSLLVSCKKNTMSYTKLFYNFYLLSESESIARHGKKDSLLWVEDSTWWINSETLHVGGLDTISNAASRRVDHLDVVGVLVVVRGIEDDLGVWLGLDVSWWDGLSHGVGVQGFWRGVYGKTLKWRFHWRRASFIRKSYLCSWSALD